MTGHRRLYGTRPDSRPARPPGPLCGKPVRRKEQGGIAVLEDPVCGRRQDHPGDCMSEAAWKRKLAADREYKRGRGRDLRNARHRRAATERAEQAAWEAARALPPDPDAAGHRAVLLAELDAFEAAHRGERWAAGTRPPAPRPLRVAALPPEGRLAQLRKAHSDVTMLRRRNRRVPVRLAELEREYARVRRQIRGQEHADAA